MQTLVDTATGISHYVFNDGRTITISSTGTLVSPISEDKYEVIEELIIPSMTTSNTTKHKGVTEPADWVGNKYKFDGSNWTKNTDFKIVCPNKCRIEDGIVTLNDYDVKFKRYAVTIIGNKKIQNIKSKDIYDFYSNIRNTTNAKEGTLKIVHAYLRKMFNFAGDLEYINRRPMAKVTAPKSVGKKFVVWSPEEVNKFLDYSKEKNIWSYYVMAFTVMTGLRRAEVCGLKWEDINWDKKTIQLTRTVHDIVGQEYPVIQHGKTKGSMTTIPVPELAMDLLKDIKGFHLTVESKVDKTLIPNNEGWVFLNSYGKLINTGWITNSFRRNLQKLDLPTPMNLRGFRHLFATYLLQQNVHPKVVQELLRHSTIKLTMDSYSHVVDSIGREAVSSIDQVLNMGKAK